MSKVTYIPNRVIDADGISDGASIYVYKTGTSTLVSLFEDNDYTTPTTNPIVVPAGAAVPSIYTNESGLLRVRIVASDGSVSMDDDPYTVVGASSVSTDQGDTVQQAIEAGRYATVAVAASKNIPTPIVAVTTLAYATTNDGGGTTYKRVASEPSHPGKFEDAGGTWWEIAPVDGVGKVESFGAIGDGATTDITALRDAHLAWKANAFNELHYRLGKSYYLGAFNGAVQTSVFGASHLSGATGKIIGNGATLVWTSDKTITHDIYLFDRNTNVEIHGLNFEDTSGIDTSPDADTNPHGVRCVTLYSSGYATNAEGYLFRNCTFRGVMACITATNDNALVGNGRIRGVRIENCVGYDSYYGINFQEDGDDAVIDFTAYNIRRAYYCYGVSGHKGRINVSHDGTTVAGSDGCVKIGRISRDTSSIHLEVLFSGDVSDYVPVNFVHLNNEGTAAGGGASLINDVDIRVTFTAASQGGVNSPGVTFSSYDATGTLLNTPLALAGDVNSPVTSKHRMRNIKIEICADTWGTEPYISSGFIPLDPGDITLIVPSNRNRRDVRLDGWLVNGWFTIEKTGASLHNAKYSIPTYHIRNSRYMLEIELFAVEGIDTAGKNYFKKFTAHGFVNSSGNATGFVGPTEREDWSYGTPDLTFVDGTGGFGAGYADRLEFWTQTAGDFNNSSGSTFARLRARFVAVKV